jgi:hypothetical protein
MPYMIPQGFIGFLTKYNEDNTSHWQKIVDWPSKNANAT